MTATITYGTTLEKGAVAVGSELVVLNPPSKKRNLIPVRSHASPEVYYLADGRNAEWDAFTAEFNSVAAEVDDLMLDLDVMSSSEYTITFPDSDTWTFDAFVTIVSMQALPSEGVGAMKVTATFQPFINPGVSATWYEDVIALFVPGGNYSMLVTNDTSVLNVWAVPSHGIPFIAPVADLTYTSATAGTLTIAAGTGIITAVDAGTSLVTAKITDDTTIDVTLTITVTNS